MDSCNTDECVMYSDVFRGLCATETGDTSYYIIREYADEVQTSQDFLSSYNGILISS